MLTKHPLRSLCFAGILVLQTFASYGSSQSLPLPKMTFLDNGEVRIGMDLALGGAVTFISSRDHPNNIINSADMGRQIQMSHYSGPWPFEAAAKKAHPAWEGLGWNPIQAGDVYLNPSRVLEHRNDGKELYIKCIPMQWPLDNVPGECVFETWTTLDGPVIHMRYRCTNLRRDKTQYRPCSQELPAVYTISRLSHLVSYVGDKPFTGEKLTQVSNDWKKPWPWTRFVATEGWAALVDDHDWGLGVFKEDGGEFHGGIYGDERSEDSRHSSTAYVAPIHLENFDYNIVYEHRTDFVVGKIDDIRKRCNQLASRTPPVWRFSQDRQHWTLRDATDKGFPCRGEWRILFGDKKPRLESGVRCWKAEDAPELALDAAYKGKAYKGKEPIRLQIFWKRLGDDNFKTNRSVSLQLSPDGQFHTHHLNLKDRQEYQGLIIGLAIEPVDPPGSAEELAIKFIELSK